MGEDELDPIDCAFAEGTPLTMHSKKLCEKR